MSEPCGSREAKRKVSRMVEAAGVEPASENTSSQTTTCVSPFDCRGRLRTEPSAPSASPDSSRPRASRRNAGTSLLNDGHSQATGLLRVTAHWFLSSESVVCVRSYVCFPQDLRGRGPRHAFRDPAPPSKPSRPREVPKPSNCDLQSTRYWMRPAFAPFHSATVDPTPSYPRRRAASRPALQPMVRARPAVSRHTRALRPAPGAPPPPSC